MYLYRVVERFTRLYRITIEVGVNISCTNLFYYVVEIYGSDICI